MAYNVRCMITGEYGKSDVFVKHDGHYFRDEIVYEEYKKQSEFWKKIIEKFAIDYLGYQSNQPFPTILPKRIKDLDFYDNETIYRTMLYSDKDIHYALETKTFKSEYGKICYIMAIIRNNINIIWKQVLQERREQKLAYQPIPSNCYASLSEIQNPKQKVKDLSKFVEN